MAAADQIKILDRKIKQNEAQYYLDGKAVKISELFCGNQDKYEYLTREGLNYYLTTVEQAKFDYSKLNKFCNKFFED